MIASLFLPVFGSVEEVKAVDEIRGPECNLFALGDFTQVLTMSVDADRTIVNYNEPFNVQVVLSFTEKGKSISEACAKNTDKYDFKLYLYGFQGSQSSYFSSNVKIEAGYFPASSGNFGGFAGRKSTTIQELRGASYAITPEMGKVDVSTTIRGYVWDNSIANYQNVYQSVPIKYTSEKPTEKAIQLAPLPGGIQVDNSQNSNGEVKDASTITFKVSQDGSSGLRNKYRVLYTEKSPFDKMIFGQNGLPKINLDWANPESKVTPEQQLKIPSKNYQIGSNPYYQYLWVGINYADKKIESDGCKSGYFVENCSGVIFIDSDKNGKQSSNQPTLPVGFDPSLYNSAWAKSEFASKTAEAGKPLGTVEFRVVPILWAKSGKVLKDWYSYVYGSQPITFTLEVYKTEADIKAACEADTNVTDKSICSDPQKMRYEVGTTVEASTGTDQKSSDAVSQLFDFIRKIIAYLVLLITSFVYWIFATILVPILVALIQVHPYKDDFVNFIYPGWIIVRNISNIAFIVALLYMGMKILFQQEDASKSRGFIVTLILMALLVNFSLVIGQGIVAIADTVQAQFLPEDSKVIETLGHKLMVDPIVIFRGGEGSLTSGGNFTADAAASDLPKAIVLLVLSLAAFFSFVALIAFMFVRLVALWVLYMVSPLAYVGRILPETKSYASQWWQEFMKYAFSVPIMAFFLNIAALVAVTFSAQSGDQVQVQGARGYLFGNATAGITEFALTTVSHFIVLLFIYAGMQYALKFGGVGAKQIVGFAKKGFDAVTQKMPKEYLKSQYARKIEGGMLDPKAWAKSWKDRVSTTDKNMRAERLSRKANRLNPGNILPPEGSLLTRAGHIAQYIEAKMMRMDPHKQLARALALRDKASILTDDERDELEKEQISNNTAKGKVENEQSLLKDNKLTNTRAKKYKDEVDDRLDQIAARRIDLISRQRKLSSQHKTDGEEYKNNERELKGMITDEAKLREAKTAILDARKRSTVRGEVELNPTDISKLSLVFNPEDLKVELSEDLKKVEGKADTYNKQLKEDDDRKRKHGVKSMTDSEREELEEEAMEISLEASKRYMPASYAAIEARRSLQADQAKKVEHMDDVDELVEAFQGAMKKNNMPFATEIAKKLAKMGGMDELLKKNGYNNNLKEFQQFIDKSFAKMAPQVRLQIGSEISTIAKSNGNLTLGNSNQYKYNVSSGESVINWAKPEQSKRKLNAKLKGMSGEALAKLEKTDFTEERGGVHYLHQGFIDALNGLGVNGMNGFLRNLPASKMNHIKKAKNLGEIRDQVRARLV